MNKLRVTIFVAIAALAISCSGSLKYSGVVRSDMGQNISDAKVVIITDKDESEITTDSSGTFKFEKINADTAQAKIQVFANGYDTYEERITLTKNMPDYPVPIELIRSATVITGMVRNKDGKPLDGVLVRNATEDESFPEKTDASGRYSIILDIDNNFIGDIQLEASKAGYKDTSVWGTPTAYQTKQIEDIIMEKKETIRQIYKPDEDKEMSKIVGPSGGGTSAQVSDINTSSITDEFLSEYRGKYFRKKTFLNYMAKNKEVKKSSAQRELQILIDNKRVKKIKTDKYYVNPN